jgi:hypothetical protein
LRVEARERERRYPELLRRLEEAGGREVDVELHRKAEAIRELTAERDRALEWRGDREKDLNDFLDVVQKARREFLARSRA